MTDIQVERSKLVYEDIIVEMIVGNRYSVETYAGETGDTVCEFISELESITIDGCRYEEIHDEYITELVFKNGVKIHGPQYDRDAVNICEED